MYLFLWKGGSRLGDCGHGSWPSVSLRFWDHSRVRNLHDPQRVARDGWWCSPHRRHLLQDCRRGKSHVWGEIVCLKNPNPNLTSTQPHTYFYRSMHEPDDDDIKHTLQCSTTDLLKTTNLRKIQKNKPNDSFSAFLIDSSPHGRSEMYRMARYIG